MSYYAAKADYGSKLSPPLVDPAAELTTGWHNVTVAMERTPSVFRDFWAQRTRGFEVPACTGECVWRIQFVLCAVRTRSITVRRLEPGFSFSKRGDGEGRSQPECHHAGMAPLLAEIAYRAGLARDGMLVS